MTKQELRLLGAAGVAIVLLSMSLFGMGWFQVAIDASGMIGLPEGTPTNLVIEVDLDSASACQAGTCTTVALDQVSRGSAYVWLGGIALWLGRALVIGVAIQVGLRLWTKQPIPLLAKLGMYAAAATFICGFLAGYVFGSTGSAGAMGLGVTVTRTWAPAMLLLGSIGAMVALYLTRATSSLDDIEEPAPRIPSAVAVKSPPAPQAPAEEPETRYNVPNRPRRVSRMPSSIPLDEPASPVSPPGGGVELDRLPRHEAGVIFHPAPTPSLDLELAPSGKLHYAAMAIEVGDGLAATREGGVRRTVAWNEIVGVVARRLPPGAPHHGVTIVDLISTPEATVRVTPSTRIVGVVLAGNDDERARKLIKLVLQRAENARLDGGTRAFVEHREPAVQLPDAETLAEHDRRLA